MTYQAEFTVPTKGRGTIDITERVQSEVTRSGIATGIAHVFIQHTSASLMLCENADPDVRGDLERWMAAHVRDGDPLFRHVDEGPDDMSAHVRSVLTQSGLSLPVAGGRCKLGLWQGLYLWEHRTQPHSRRITVTVIG